MSGPLSDLEQMAPALVLMRRLEEAYLHKDVELIVPKGVLDGVTTAWGLPVRQIAGLDAVYVGHRVPLNTTPLFPNGTLGPR